MTELAWAAGFFDGEGSVRAAWNAGKAQAPNRTRSLRCVVGQREREPLDRFAAAVGVGKVYGPSFTQSKTCAMFRWEIGGRDAVFRVRRLLSPWLCSRKQDQFDAAIVRYHDMEAGESND